MKRAVVFLSVFFLFIGSQVGFTPDNADAKEKIVKWDLALGGGRRAFTIPIEKWAEAMKEKTKGKWIITLHYGNALNPVKENLEGVKAGMFEAGQYCHAYHPGKVPLLTVFDLPFIAPESNADCGELLEAYHQHPLVKKELLRWNGVRLLSCAIPPYHIMSNKPVRNIKDLDGLRIRTGGEIARGLKKFNAVPTMIGPSELYEALSRGTIDAVTFPWYAFGSYKVYEVAKYATPMYLGCLGCGVIANKNAWDALPEAYKQYHNEWLKNGHNVWAEEYDQADKKWLPIFKKKLTFFEFPESERKKIVAKAGEVYDEWVKDREKSGLPGREMLNFFLEKRKEIAGK